MLGCGNLLFQTLFLHLPLSQLDHPLFHLCIEAAGAGGQLFERLLEPGQRLAGRAPPLFERRQPAAQLALASLGRFALSAEPLRRFQDRIRFLIHLRAATLTLGDLPSVVGPLVARALSFVGKPLGFERQQGELFLDPLALRSRFQ